MSFVQIQNISKKYGRKEILSDVSLHANKGECIAIVGANGCGKSTLLSILAGALKPNSGLVSYDGKEALKNKKVFSQHVGYVPQENPLLDKLSVIDNLRFWYCGTDKDLKEDMKTGIPAIFGLTPYKDYTVDKLSGGLKKRLSIACALAKDPFVLILDEPGASLDIVCKEDIKRYLKEYLKQGGAVIITSHEEAELSICDRMYLLNSGKLYPLENKLMGEALLDRIKWQSAKEGAYL